MMMMMIYHLFLTSKYQLLRKLETWSWARWKAWCPNYVIGYKVSLTFKVIWGHRGQTERSKKAKMSPINSTFEIHPGIWFLQYKQVWYLQLSYTMLFLTQRSLEVTGGQKRSKRVTIVKCSQWCNFFPFIPIWYPHVV